ncbi:ceramidase domain-containing protein [Frigoriglobus tundricola]|uniref:Ceramidase n=1 Tax=Frigoriglobus tundricola TaxID=2774151 RepID=A0A6M5Z1I1_9BACT|nr:ceramidase domain-containing protein [Frigoriglobus tundricola]QJX00210.1 hypothetical protein FTUN_7834 [Frigoriglobus tundricola]
MPEQPATAEPVAQPDWGLVVGGQLPDRGPRYVETPPDPAAPDAPFIAEPWNTVTASFFIWIALAWLWRLRGRYRDYPFMISCMPILLAGGIGGTLYHGTRTARVWFYLDVVPISLLGLVGALYMAYRLFDRYERVTRLAILFVVTALLLVVYFVVNLVLFSTLRPTNRQLSINLSYASLAVLVLTPIALVLWRTRFRHGGWVVAGVISFAMAWFFRLFDQYSAGYLPMGSHWLWHTFGTISTGAVVQYFYKVEGETVEKKPEAPANRAR